MRAHLHQRVGDRAISSDTFQRPRAVSRFARYLEPVALLQSAQYAPVALASGLARRRMCPRSRAVTLWQEIHLVAADQELRNLSPMAPAVWIQ
jgi:hypothetical protein